MWLCCPAVRTAASPRVHATVNSSKSVMAEKRLLETREEQNIQTDLPLYNSVTEH